MNILITDDISNNREILERLIRQYSRKYEVTCNVFHAQNGQEAVELCETEAVELVFMDIRMPVMDGLEATKKIKKAHPGIMIIVISSEDDEDVKVEILQNGAEDYVIKPFSGAVMISRLHNYQRLISSRNKIGYHTRAINNFSRNVYSYQMKFFIGNDDELAQFWETMLVRFEFQHHISNLSDFVRFLYRLGSYQIQKSYRCHLYVEEDEHTFFFTMDNMRLFSKEFLYSIIEKYCQKSHYELEGDLLTFALPRVGYEQESTYSPQDSCPIEATVKPQIKEQLQTFDLLDETSLSEFEHLLGKLKTEISMMGSSSLDIDDIDTINGYIKQMAAILEFSEGAYTVARVLRQLSELLDDQSEAFLAMSKDLSHMVGSFVNDIIMWKDMIFYSGAPSIDFLDSSIISGVQMIQALFITDDEETSVDDIFDF